MTNLLAHCDTKRVEESVVKAIPEPEFTKTWHPVGHGRVIDVMAAACKDYGLEIVNKEYSINKNGSKMFGVWDLDHGGNGGMGFSLGLRNGIAKNMLLGVCAGTRVFVCDNLCFSGTFIKFRKHTSGLDDEELLSIAEEAIGGAIIEMDKLSEWHKSLKEVYVPRPDFKGMVFDMMQKGVFSPSGFNEYMNHLEDEKKIIHGTALDGANSLFAVHGAATRLMRSWNLLRVGDATKILNGICDDYMIQKAA